MQRIVLFLLSLAFSASLSAQAPTWILADAGGSNGPDEAWAVAEDSQGNYYVFGHFFGTAVMGGNTLVSQGGTDIFLLCYSPAGQFLWSKQFGGSLGDFGLDLEIWNDQIYISGSFSGTAQFDNNTVISRGFDDIYVARLDLSGNVQWVFTGGSPGRDTGYGVRPDGFGNVFFGGQIKDNAIFVNDTVPSRGDEDLFLGKLDTAGTYLWGRSGGSIALDRGWSISSDPVGNGYVAGNFRTTAVFGNDTVMSRGAYDAIVVSYDPNGNLRWIKTSGGTADDFALGVEAGPGGNVYLTGYFANNGIFGNDTILSRGLSDLFLTKYDNNGTEIWTRSGGGVSNDFSNGVTVDNQGNASIVGRMEGTAYIGSDTVLSFFADVIVAAWDGNGSFLFSARAGGFAIDQGIGISAAANGAFFLAGSVGPGADFGPISVPSFGNTDAFVAKISNLANEPTQGSTSLFATGTTCNSVNLSWQSGNGANRLVVVRESQPVSIQPLDGSTYTPNAVFGQGTDLGNGNYIAYSGNGNSFTLSGLQPDSAYFLSIYEYNGSLGATNYKTDNPFNSSVNTLPLTLAAITPSSGANVCTGDSLQLAAVNFALNHQWYLNGNTIAGATNGTYFATQPGSYTLTVSDAPGCSDSTQTPVVVGQLQSPTASVSFTQNGITFDFTGTSAAAVSYDWDFGDGSSSTLQNPSHTYTTAGPVTVCLTVTDAQPCSSTECVNISVPVGREAALLGEGVTAVPNPGSDQTRLSFPQEVSTIKLFALDGKEVSHLSPPAGTTEAQLDLSGLEAGLYLILFIGDEQMRSLKLLVE